MVSCRRVFFLFIERFRIIYFTVIAVGYSSGVVRICDVEKGDLVYVGSVKGSVTSLEWLEQSEHMTQGPDHYAEDNSSDYLPVSQQLNSL